MGKKCVVVPEKKQKKEQRQHKSCVDFVYDSSQWNQMFQHFRNMMK